jgi:hypothetical protein|nr:MAG TPA: hyaluronase tail fiber protein [Caudoviricetes sp.]
MANVPKAITDLPVASAMGDDDLLVVSQNATTSSIKGELIKGYAQNAVASQVTAAQTAANQAGDAKADAETARNEAETSASSAANSASDAESAAAEAEQAKTYIENMDMEGETLPAGSSVTVTKTTSPEGNLLFVIGVPQGIQGDKGDTGETGATGPQGVSITNATVNEDGDLVITLSSGSPINAGSVIGPQGIQGEVGPTGASVDRIERTSGTGAPGTTDTYTVYLTDGETGGTFQVYNGSNGAGSGDFMADGSVPMTGDLQMGGHKITNLAEPTDNTDAASKEYVDDTITVSLVGNYIPMGQKGQANGVASLDNSGKVPNEQLPPMDYVPTSRTVNGHALSADVTLDAEDVGAIPNPSGGTTGQVLTKTSTGEEWSDAPSGLPEGGTEGQILEKTSSGAAWVDAPESGLTQSEADERYLQLTGGELNDDAIFQIPGDNGSLYLGGRNNVPNVGMYASSSGYITLHDNTTGNVNIRGVRSPEFDYDAANKAYVDSKAPTSVAITLTTSGWSSNTQTVTVPGVVASETAQLITPTPAIASQSAYYEAGIMCTNQGTNSLTFTCQTVPTSNLTVYVVIQPLS